MHEPSGANKKPFQSLGSHLKFVREQSHESLAEAAGAVEIGIEELERIESGSIRPSEEILMLLINHFGMQDQEAVQLWESAGYEQDGSHRQRLSSDTIDKNTLLVLAIDMRTQYTDAVEVTANKAGIVMQFNQSANQGQLPVARVGMSYEQAEQVLTTLQRAILHGRCDYTQRRLAPPNDE